MTSEPSAVQGSAEFVVMGIEPDDEDNGALTPSVDGPARHGARTRLRGQSWVAITSVTQVIPKQ